MKNIPSNASLSFGVEFGIHIIDFCFFKMEDVKRVVNLTKH